MECLYSTQADNDFSLIFPNLNTSESKLLNTSETPTISTWQSFFLPCQKSLKTFSIHKPIFVSNRCDTPNKWEWHEASAVALNSICDAPWTRWQCSLFCCLSLFITPSSLDNIQKLIPLGNLCASLPRVFSRAELSLQHQAKALPGNEQHPAGSCIKVIHYTEEADFKILENVTLWKRKNKNQFPIFS